MVCLVHLNAAVRYYPYYAPSRQQLFGEQTIKEIGKQHETRWGFPLVTREVIFAFPSVGFRRYFQVSDYGKTMILILFM